MAKIFTKLFFGDVVKTVGSRVFRKLTTEQLVVEDELQGTWVFNDTLTLSTAVDYSVNFTSNGVSYTLLTVWHADSVMPRPRDLYYTNSDVEFQVYYNVWHNQAYKTINITSKLAEVENGTDLLAWLKENATKQTTPTIGTFYRQFENMTQTTTYEFEVGMTWEQWINSSYCVGNYRVSDGIVQCGDTSGWFSVQYNNVTVSATDEIIDGATYITPCVTESGGAN